MLNCAKVSIVKDIIKYFFLFLFFSLLSKADEVTKYSLDNGYCYKQLNFHECTFNDGSKIIGQLDNSGKWNKNVKKIYQNGDIDYLYYRNGEIRYGIRYFDNGYYIGDLTSSNTFYDFGSVYFNNGEKWSFQNWHEEKKLGYKQFPNGSKLIGRFNKDFKILIEIPLNRDFQSQLDEMEILARKVEINFKREYEKFLSKKRIYLSNSSNQTSSSTKKLISSKNNKDNQSIFVSLGIILILIVIVLLKNASSSKITQTETKENQNRRGAQKEIERYKDFSLADSRKLFSYGVKKYMSMPEACKQLRSEYFKWMTVSNNPDGLKKSLSKKNINNIIQLRKKLEC